MSNSDSKNFDYKAFYEWWCKQTSLVRELTEAKQLNL